MTADQEGHALITSVIQQREDATVPQDIDHRPAARSGGGHVLPPLHTVTPGCREQAYQCRHERQLHPANSRASPATRSAAPGGPKRWRTRPSPSRWRRAASLSGSSNGSTAVARAAGVTPPLRRPELTPSPPVTYTHS